MPKRQIILVLGSLLLLGLVAESGGSRAQDVQSPTLQNPFPDIRAAQDQRKDKILKLLKLALDQSAPAKERANAVVSLSGVGFDYLLANAEPLVKSDKPEVALATVSVLSGEIAMLPSEGHHHANTTSGPHDPLSEYQDKIVARVTELLRLALHHQDHGVRGQAATVLASRGDTQSLATIQSMIDSGALPAKEGIGYLTLAPANVASPFIAKYLESGSSDVQAAAAAQLAYNPTYVAQVRALALSPQTNNTVVLAALPGLAVGDKDFLQYGVALSQNTDKSPAVRNEAVKAVVRATINQQLDRDKAGAIASSLGETARVVGSPDAAKAVQGLRLHYNLP